MKYSWYIAIPVAIVTVLVVMRQMIWEWVMRFIQRRHILGIRKKRTQKAKMKRKKMQQKWD